MKHYIFCALLACMSAATAYSADPVDAASMKTLIEQGNKPVITAIEKQTQSLKQRDSIAAVNLAKVKSQAVAPSRTVENIISFLPVLFFFFITATIFIKLRKDGVKFSDILIDKETAQERIKSDKEVAVAAVNAGQPLAAANAQNLTGQTTQDPPEKSTSRLIVFICGLTSIALACCITTYYFYKSFTGTGDVDLGKLTNVLYGLGLGVLPYGFNKIAAALK